MIGWSLRRSYSMKPEVRVHANLVNLGARNRVVDIRGLRKKSFPYVFVWVLYYAWVITFATWWTASPLTENVFGSNVRYIMHVANLLSSAAFVFIIRKEWFVKTARVGAMLIIAGMGVFLIVQDARIQLASAVIIAISLGCVNISILMPFVFAFNNTEKLYAVVGSNVLINVISLFMEDEVAASLQSNSKLMISSVLMIIALSATLFFKNDCFAEGVSEKRTDEPRMQVWVYLSLVLNCVFAILCRGAGKGVLNIAAMNSDYRVLTLYYLGGVVGCLVYVAVYAFSKKAIHLAWNITFGCLAMGLLLNASSSQAPGLAVVFAILFGISGTMGMINMYYILGVIGKKYNSMRYVQLSILLIGICGGISGVVLGDLITRINTFGVSLIASVVSAAVVLIFLVFAPAFASVYYEDEWAKDSKEMDIDNEQLHLFRKYKLSNREIEVCKLLLQGYTMRQIAAILSLAYPTVNTYCTSIYRKLNINSRTELLLVFKDYALR